MKTQMQELKAQQIMNKIELSGLYVGTHNCFPCSHLLHTDAK